jgi:hypothetical protein
MNLLSLNSVGERKTNLEDKYMRVAQGASHPRVSSSEEALEMTGRSLAGFDPADFLSKAVLGRRIVQLKTKEPLFSPADKGDSETKSSLVYRTAQSLAR